MELHDASSQDQKQTEASSNYDAERYFIFTFETLSVLWDPQHKFYSSKYKRLEALKQLQNVYKRIKPGATVDDVRKKINSLRSNYRREQRKIDASKKSGLDDSHIYKPKLWSFQYMNFLKNAEHPDALLHKAKIKIKSEDLSQSEPGENSSSSERETEQSPTENDSQHFFPTKIVSSPFPTIPKIAKVESLSKQANLLDRSSSKLSLSHRIGSQTNSSTLASLWIEKLERLHPVQKLFAEKAINDILFEAELGNLRRNSVKINEPLVAESTSCVAAPTASSSSHLEHMQQR